MVYNEYIFSLMSLRRKFESRIDEEIEICMRGWGNSEKLKESLTYIIKESNALNGCYKKWEGEDK